MNKSMFVIVLLLLSLGIVYAGDPIIDPCALAFDEGSLERISCSDFLKAKAALPDEDARIAFLQVRINNILTSMGSNSTDRAWVEQMVTTVDGFASELSSAIDKRETFLLEADLIRDATQSVINLPQAALDLLLVDSETLQENLGNWQATESDLALLTSDLQKALANLPPAETDDAEPEQAPEPEDVQNVESLPIDTSAGLPDARTIIATAVQSCQAEADENAQNICIFTSSWVAFHAVQICEENDLGADCFAEASAFVLRDLPEENWQAIMEQYGALDDPIASLAVLQCQIFPVFNEDGEEVPLGNCAQIEYFNLLDAAENPENTSDGITDSDENLNLISGEWTTLPLVQQCGENTAISVTLDAIPFSLTASDDAITVTFPGDPQSYTIPRTAPDLFYDAESDSNFRVLAPDRLQWDLPDIDCTYHIEAELITAGE